MVSAPAGLCSSELRLNLCFSSSFRPELLVPVSMDGGHLWWVRELEPQKSVHLSQFCCFNPRQSCPTRPPSAPAHPVFDLVSANTFMHQTASTAPSQEKHSQFSHAVFSAFSFPKGACGVPSARGTKSSAQWVKEAAPCVPSDPFCNKSMRPIPRIHQVLKRGKLLRTHSSVPRFPLNCCDSLT